MRTNSKPTTVVLAASFLVLLGAVLPATADLPVTSGLTLWLKTDTLSGLNHGDPVSTWTDSSGNSYHATQATASMQPTYITNGLAGRPVVTFAGDNLETPAIAALSGLSAFMVARSADLGDRYALQFGHDTRAIIEGFGSTNWRWFNTPATVTLQPMSTTAFQTIWTTNGASFAGIWHIGADSGVTAPFAGSMAEVVVFDRVLSAAETTQMLAYFDAEYFIPEPSSATLLALGGVLVLGRRRASKK